MRIYRLKTQLPSTFEWLAQLVRVSVLGILEGPRFESWIVSVISALAIIYAVWLTSPQIFFEVIYLSPAPIVYYYIVNYIEIK